MAVITKTEFIIDGHFGKENFTGVVGILPDVPYCTDPLLLTYINGLLTGQFIPNKRIIRLISDGDKFKSETTTTLQKETLVIKHDTGSITLKDGKYKVTYFPRHDIYYASAQYGGNCGGCQDLCSYGWEVGVGDDSISKLYNRQITPLTTMDIIKNAFPQTFTTISGTASGTGKTDDPIDVDRITIQGVEHDGSDCIDDPHVLDTTTQVDILDLTEVEFD